MSEQPDGFTCLTYWIPAILVAMMISACSTHNFTDERTSESSFPFGTGYSVGDTPDDAPHHAHGHP
jgi:hypothetical protein